MYKKRLTKEQVLQKLRFYCRYQQRCESEIKDKLFELGINKKDHDALVNELVKENCVSDDRFAQAFVRGRFKLKQWGRRKIQKGLKDILDLIAKRYKHGDVKHFKKIKVFGLQVFGKTI